MMSTGIFTVCGLIVVSVWCFLSSCRSHETFFRPSCGNLTNISPPFYLWDDQVLRGGNNQDGRYRLFCRNNQTILDYLGSEESPRCYVEAINYNNYTIRFVDRKIHKGDCSSLPLDDSPCRYGYRDDSTFGMSGHSYVDLPGAKQVKLLDCENPVEQGNKRSRGVRYKEATGASNCISKYYATSNQNRRHHFYFLFADYTHYGDIEEGCTLLFSTFLSDVDVGNEDDFSFLDFHDKLAFGYEMSWIPSKCPNCSEDYACHWDTKNNHAYCRIVSCYYGNSVKCRWKNFVHGPLGEFWFTYRTYIVGIPAARTSCGVLCLFLLVIYKYRRRNLSMFESIEEFLQSNSNLMPIRYSYSQIRKMTNGLKDKLGEGGFGSVYKGKLRSGAIVAIKILTNSNSNGRDFVNEVATIGRIHHTNVVRLIGFCVEGSKRALVYDFMPNGSLEKYIFSQEGTTLLSCNQMFDISVGVAHAIEYLHRGCEMQILHFDIKPHNILLDANFNPKVSDFGLAKLYPAGKSMVTLTEARGTMGYIAPEMFYKNIGRVSYKADVYSFGMLLLEMAGRRKNLNVYADQTSQIYFPSWVYDEFNEGREVEMGETTEDEKKKTKKMIITAFWCTQMKPSDRPSMEKVVEMLEGDIELLQMPRKPSLNPQEIPAETI